MQANATLSLSPSFSSYSNCRIAEIAARTVDEFDSDEFSDDNERKSSAVQIGDEDEEEFEFAMTARDSDFPSQTSAGEIFQNGKIRPVYSLLNRDYWFGGGKTPNEIGRENNARDSVSPKIRLPLRKLFLEERETAITASSSSSSEADEFDGVPTVTYCVWPPRAEEEEGRCKKNRCNSKRWKLKDFLHKNSSHGIENNNFVMPEENEKKSPGTPQDSGKVGAVAPLPPPCNLNGGEKLRSYLGYGLPSSDVNAKASSKKLESF